MGNFISRLLQNNRQQDAREAQPAIISAAEEVSEDRKPEKKPSIRKDGDIIRAAPSPQQEPQPPQLAPAPAPKPVFYRTTFEALVDAAPPHPLELEQQQFEIDEQIEIDTNLVSPEVEDAVVKIQAGIRGYLTRKNLKDKVEAKTEAIQIVPPPTQFDDVPLIPKTSQTSISVQESMPCHRPDEDEETRHFEEEEAAVKIQAAFRGFMSRKQMTEVPQGIDAGDLILTPEVLSEFQPNIVDIKNELNLADPPAVQVDLAPSVEDEEEAAVKIQAAYRGYQTRKALSRETSPCPSDSHLDSTDQLIDVNHFSIENRNTLNPNQAEINENLIRVQQEETITVLDELEEQLLQQLLPSVNENLAQDVETAMNEAFIENLLNDPSEATESGNEKSKQTLDFLDDLFPDVTAPDDDFEEQESLITNSAQNETKISNENGPREEFSLIDLTAQTEITSRILEGQRIVDGEEIISFPDGTQMELKLNATNQFIKPDLEVEPVRLNELESRSTDDNYEIIQTTTASEIIDEARTVTTDLKSETDEANVMNSNLNADAPLFIPTENIQRLDLTSAIFPQVQSLESSDKSNLISLVAEIHRENNEVPNFSETKSNDDIVALKSSEIVQEPTQAPTGVIDLTELSSLIENAFESSAPRPSIDADWNVDVLQQVAYNSGESSVKNTLGLDPLQLQAQLASVVPLLESLKPLTNSATDNKNLTTLLQELKSEQISPSNDFLQNSPISENLDKIISQSSELKPVAEVEKCEKYNEIIEVKQDPAESLLTMSSVPIPTATSNDSLEIPVANSSKSDLQSSVDLIEKIAPLKQIDIEQEREEAINHGCAITEPPNGSSLGAVSLIESAEQTNEASSSTEATRELTLNTNLPLQETTLASPCSPEDARICIWQETKKRQEKAQLIDHELKLDWPFNCYLTSI